MVVEVYLKGKCKDRKIRKNQLIQVYGAQLKPMIRITL